MGWSRVHHLSCLDITGPSQLAPKGLSDESDMGSVAFAMGSLKGIKEWFASYSPGKNWLFLASISP